MSMEVQQFLNDTGGNFTEMAPRPPVPGEETAELQSNGGISTRSSGSHKSHLSGKSHSSGKSAASHRSDVSHSPAATPRRSNLDKMSLSCSETKLNMDDVDAPLGFEPEGSVANSPPFTENSTPPYLKWAENLNYLLEDSDGVKLFKQYLDQDQCSNLLDFWFACKGLKMVGEDDLERLSKLIYKKYIKGDQLTLKPEIKKNIVEHLKREQYGQTLFDEAQADVENMMKNDTYPQFLKSDLYLQYVQNGGESPKTSNNSSGSSSARPLSGPLPTVHEGEVLSTDDIKRTSAPALPLTPATLFNTRRSREAWSLRRPESVYPPSNSKLPNPYHVSYAPVSAQDSELQSLSSDALTDDTMSLTDSSVDGRDLSGYGKKAWKKQQKAIKRYADTNKITHLNQHVIPRTERAPKDRNLAEKEPEKFAAMLTERLMKVKEEREKMERVKENLQSLETDEEKDAVLMPPPMGCPPIKSSSSSTAPAGSSGTTAPSANPLGVLLAMADNDREDNAQSILEEHVSRIWDNSNGQTPSRSPGRHSPKSWSHDLSFKYPYPPGPSPNVSGSGNLMSSSYTKGHSRRRDKEGNAFLSNASYDSGMGTEDKTGVYYEPETHHKYVYHHHHHHHHVIKDTQSKSRPSAPDPEAHSRSLHHHLGNPLLQNFSDSFGGVSSSSHRGHGHSFDDPGRVRSKDSSKRSSGKKALDSSSNLDSGVGPSEPTNITVPNLHDPANEKVLAWMLENEKLSSSVNPQNSTDGSDKGSSHKRSSHKSSSTSHKGVASSSSKKSSQYNTSRSGSLDRSGYNSYHQPVGGDYSFNTSLGSGVMPSQPIVQDPSMPPLPTPNTMTQIEEAKRRLEVESSRASMRQSKSFTGPSSSSRDRRGMPPPQGPAIPPRGASTSTHHSVGSAHHSGSSYHQSGSSHPINTSYKQNIPQLAPLDLSSSEDHSSHGSHKSSEKRSSKKPSSSAPTTPATPQGASQTVVGYFFCGEPIPYRTTLPGKHITLGQFKQLISKKGNYRYFFKTISDEFDSGVVHEEVHEDSQILPMWENKIIGKVEKKE